MPLFSNKRGLGDGESGDQKRLRPGLEPAAAPALVAAPVAAVVAAALGVPALAPGMWNDLPGDVVFVPASVSTDGSMLTGGCFR